MVLLKLQFELEGINSGQESVDLGRFEYELISVLQQLWVISNFYVLLDHADFLILRGDERQGTEISQRQDLFVACQEGVGNQWVAHFQLLQDDLNVLGPLRIEQARLFGNSLRLSRLLLGALVSGRVLLSRLRKLGFEKIDINLDFCVVDFVPNCVVDAAFVHWRPHEHFHRNLWNYLWLHSGYREIHIG